MPYRQQGVALLVFQVHAIEVEGVAEIRPKLSYAYLRLELVAQVALGPAGHKVLPGRKLQRYYDYYNKEQD